MGREVWDSAHRRRAEAAALAHHAGRHLHALPDPIDPDDAVGEVAQLDLGGGDYDIATPDLARYQVLGCECAGWWAKTPGRWIGASAQKPCFSTLLAASA